MPLPYFSASQKGWLAGIIDGEGCLYLKMEKNRKRYPVVQIEMTDYRTLARIHTLLTRFGQPRWTNVKSRHVKYRPAYRVTLRRPESVLRLLNSVGRHLVTKAHAAETLREAALNNIAMRRAA
jgi:hypothetical protein